MRILSEDQILDIINTRFSSKHNSFTLGRGDDCAFLKADSNLAITTDLFLEDIHFRRAYFMPEDIGYKALAVNLSDLAACASNPAGFSLCLGLPKNLDSLWLDAFFSGMASLASSCNIFLCGGDLSRSDKIHVSITAFGRKPDSGKLLQRSKPNPGDIIFVIGKIGLARIGLHELEKNGRESCAALWPEAFMAHLHPRPLLAEAQKLGKYSLSHSEQISLMDISDGIARDLPRLLGKALGAELDFSQEKLSPEVIRHAEANAQDPFMAALTGGEDYALLGTCSPKAFKDLQQDINELWTIGMVSKKQEIKFREQKLGKGFDHFMTL